MMVCKLSKAWLFQYRKQGRRLPRNVAGSLVLTRVPAGFLHACCAYTGAEISAITDVVDQPEVYSGEPFPRLGRHL